MEASVAALGGDGEDAGFLLGGVEGYGVACFKVHGEFEVIDVGVGEAVREAGELLGNGGGRGVRCLTGKRGPGGG